MASYRGTLLLLAALISAAGCRSPRQIRDRDYAQVLQTIRQAHSSPAPAAAAVAPVAVELEGPQDVQRLIQIALDQNPEVQAARKRMEAMAMRVPQAASLADPMVDAVGWPFFPNVPQTASGRMTVDVMLSQQVPWHGKLAAKAEAAEAEVKEARSNLAAVELATIEMVKRSYYELYYVQQAIRLTVLEQEELAKIRSAAYARYRATLTSQQDVLRAELELSQSENELIQLRQQLASAQARLARLLHASPQTELRAVEELPEEQAPHDLSALEERAVAARPELHARLAALERDRRMLDLARLDYRPDFTFKLGWGEMTTSRALAPSADGLDNVTAGVSVNVPLYRKRLDASVREAEANVVAMARQYDALRDGTLEQVADLFAQARSQQELLQLFREDILPKARQTYEISSSAYSVGEVDFLQLIDNFRQQLRYELSYRRLEASLLQTLAELERVVGGQLPIGFDAAAPPELPSPADDDAPSPEEIAPSVEAIRLPQP